VNDGSEIFKEYLKDERFIDETHKKKLLSLTKDFIAIGNTTGKIFLTNSEKMSNSEKALFYLIGVYIAHVLGLRDKNKADLSELSNELNIVKTTLSAPIKNLLDSKMIRRDDSVDPSDYYVTSVEVQRFIVNEEKKIGELIK
jgi:hypothetical protein